MKTRRYALPLLALVSLFVMTAAAVYVTRATVDGGQYDEAITTNTDRMMEEGKEAFRHDTFGDEAFWSDALGLHQTIAGEANGGIGPGLSPAAALAVGLKVDVDALPPDLVEALENGEVDLDDPAVTLALLQLDAVVGVKGTFAGDELSAVGITCAVCHSTVDNSFAPGIGERLDGWANQDLDAGAVIAFAPDLTPFTSLLGVDEETVRTVLQSWGPGKFDASLLMDGKAFRPDGEPAATLIPAAYGLAGVNLHTWTGWGSVTHWNAFVANLEMSGQGTFFDPRLDDAAKFPIAAREGFGHVRSDPDLVTPHLAALQFYQLALPAPAPPAGTFDPALAATGEILFNGPAQCAACHVPPLFTEPGYNMHTPEEIGIDDFQSGRSPDERYRTAPLKGLWTRTRGFYHDGRFETLEEVVEHYDAHFDLGLSSNDVQALKHYLLSLGDADVGGTALEPLGASSPLFELDPNYPNPFEGRTTITYRLQQPSEVTLEVYDVTGRLVSRIEQGHRPVGEHTIVWDGGRQGVASGAYFYRLHVGDRAQTQKMTLIR